MPILHKKYLRLKELQQLVHIVIQASGDDGCVYQEMQKAANKKKSLIGILRIAVQEALIQVTTQMCSKRNRKWQGDIKARDKAIPEKLYRLSL